MALAFLVAAGASLGLFVLLLPHPDSVDEVGVVAAVALVAYPAGALVLALRPLSRRLLHAATVLGIALITTAVSLSGELGGAYAFYYLWAALFAAYFFSAAKRPKSPRWPGFIRDRCGTAQSTGRSSSDVATSRARSGSGS